MQTQGDMTMPLSTDLGWLRSCSAEELIDHIRSVNPLDVPPIVEALVERLEETAWLLDWDLDDV